MCIQILLYYVGQQISFTDGYSYCTPGTTVMRMEDMYILMHAKSDHIVIDEIFDTFKQEICVYETLERNNSRTAVLELQRDYEDIATNIQNKASFHDIVFY